MIENQNISNDVSVTEKVNGGGETVVLTEEENTVVYDLSPEDFDALAANATELQLKVNETIQADTCVCCAERTEHWFKLTVLQTGDYSFSANTYGLISCQLYDVTRTELVSDNVGEEDTDFLINYTLFQGQVYYLRIIPNRYGFSRFNTVITGVYTSPYEESMATAQAIYLDVRVNGYFLASQQEQWYKFTVSENGQYTIHTTGSLNTIGALYDNFGYLITEQNGYKPAESSNFRIRHYLTANTTYYVQVREANEKSGPFKLFVTKQQLVDSVSINPSELVLGKIGVIYELPARPNTYLNIDGTKALNNISLTVTPKTIEDKQVRWSCFTTNVINVIEHGSGRNTYYTMTVVGEGTAKLYAEDWDRNGKRGECTVYVGGSPVTGINLECTQKTISVGDSAYILSTVYPPDALNKNVVWKSSNQAIAEVDKDGCVTVYGVGTAIITATTVDGGYTATCTVTGDPRPHVVIEKEVEGGHDFFKVTFPESEGGLIWKSVGIDLDDDSVTVNGYPHHWDRNAFNHGQQFNEKQLAFLYLLDPHGVTRYVKNIYTRFDGSADERIYLSCMFKDRLYEKIFGKSPRLLRVFPDNSISYYDTWNPNIEKEARIVFYSDAEILFGTHAIDDLLSWLGVIVNYGIPIVTSLFGTIFPTLGTVLSAVELCKVVFFAGAINDTLSSGATSSLEEYLKTFIQNKGDPDIDPNFKDYKGAFSSLFGWLMFGLDFVITVVESSSAFHPSVEQVVIYDKVNSSVDYRVTLKNGVADLTMQELVEYCEE